MEPEPVATVVFFCPLCNGDTAELITGRVEALPREPCLKCLDCGTLWRVSLWQVEEPRND